MDQRRRSRPGTFVLIAAAGATGSVALKEELYGNHTLVSGAGSVSGATDLSGWTVTGVAKPERYSVELAGNDIVLHGIPAGSLFFFR